MNDPLIARIIAAVLLVAGAVIVATSGDSVSVRFLTALVTADVSVRLLTHSGLGAARRTP